MTSLPQVQDVLTYLLDTGWQRHPETWNGASIWSNADRHEILVPASDRRGDADLRIAEILSVLTATENRPAADIIAEINRPFDDIQLYRTITDEDFLYFPAAMGALSSVRDLIAAAARSLMAGPAPVVASGAPEPVEELLRQVRLETVRGPGHALIVRIPAALRRGSADEQPPAPARDDLGRQLGRHLHEAVASARSAAERVTAVGDADAFDTSVAAGVSANLCDALSGLAGGDQAWPFEITFRWARGVPSGAASETIRFPAASAPAFRAGAARLRRIASAEDRRTVSGTGTIIGLVESLHGAAPQGFWRVRIRGDLQSDAGISGPRVAWTDLSDPEAYDRAMTAHRYQRLVRVSGELSATRKRTELTVRNSDFEIVGGNE